MPLLDHFHEPVDLRRRWDSFHGQWASSIAAALNAVLPPRYFAGMHVHLGRHVEADVAEFESVAAVESNGESGGVAVQTYAPPAAVMVVPAVFPDQIEVQVSDLGRDGRLVAVIELVSPANKDRDEARRAFAAKSAAYLQKGVGLIVVDVVTTRQFNLHDEWATLMGLEESFHMPGGPGTYAVAYRPARRNEQNQIDVWPAPLAVGDPLPTLPLALLGSGCVPLDLEATYTEARQRSRLT